MRALILLMCVLTACGIAEERYLHLRQMEDCRIFGPSCVRDYETVEECLGDEGHFSLETDPDRYDAGVAQVCINDLRQLCPVRAVDFVLPAACNEVYRDGEE
jgi:hypothetical protein